MKKTILVSSKYESRKTGKPVCSFIDYEEAPEWMQRRYDSLHKPLTAEQAARAKEAAKRDLHFAYNLRRACNDRLGIETFNPLGL